MRLAGVVLFALGIHACKGRPRIRSTACESMRLRLERLPLAVTRSQRLQSQF